MLLFPTYQQFLYFKQIKLQQNITLLLFSFKNKIYKFWVYKKGENSGLGKVTLYDIILPTSAQMLFMNLLRSLKHMLCCKSPLAGTGFHCEL